MYLLYHVQWDINHSIVKWLTLNYMDKITLFNNNKTQ